MKKLFLLTSLALASLGAGAQLTTPAPSPASTVKQTVGLTDITIEYSRPSARDRVIFGDLVPYGKMWRTGANKNPMITFSTEATVGGTTLTPGTYAIFTVPGQKEWEVIFYKDTENWGTPENWDESKVAARTKVPSHSVQPSVESFTMGIDHLKNNGAHLTISWATTEVAVPFTVPTDKAVMSSIEKTMAGPSANDYFSAAVYYYQEGKDLKQASEWIDKAIATRSDAFWMYRQKSLIHAKMGDKKGAIESAKTSLELAEKAGNMDYVKMNKDSLKEWGAM